MLKRLLFQLGTAFVPILSLMFSGARPSEASGCKIFDPSHDGAVHSHISPQTEVGMDGRGLHAVNENDLPGIDTDMPEVFPPFSGIVAEIGWDEGASGGWFVMVRGVGVCEGAEFWVLHQPADPRKTYHLEKGSEVTPNTVIGSPGQSGFYLDRFGLPVAGRLNYLAHNHLVLGFPGLDRIPGAASSEVPLVDGKIRNYPRSWSGGEAYYVNIRDVVSPVPYETVVPGFVKVPESEDWELRFLTPQAKAAGFFLSLCLFAVLLILFTRSSFRQARNTTRSFTGKAKIAGLFAISVTLFLVSVLVWVGISKAALWPMAVRGPLQTGSSLEAFELAASEVGYGDPLLLAAFYKVGVEREADGKPVSPGRAGLRFPPEVAAAVPFGETNSLNWGEVVDPTTSGPWGRFIAWDAVASRWPASWYERAVLGKVVSTQAQKQRDGLTAVALYLNASGLAERLGHPIEPQEIYGSSAGAIGRTQILPSYFAGGALCGDAPKDPWNDPITVAECTTRHLVVAGCWGSWYVNGDIWSALCGYNPGAWDNPQTQWYWDVLEARINQLNAVAGKYSLAYTDGGAEASVGAPAAYVSTPILGLLVTKDALGVQQGLGSSLPAGFYKNLSEKLSKDEPAALRTLYRVFRAWVILSYNPEELASLGIQP